MQHIARSAALYFACVFAVGFMAGTIRVLLIEPNWGETLAALTEMPVMLTAIAVSAWRVPAFTGIRRAFLPLLGMGIGALTLQQIADIAVGVFLRDLTIAEQYAQFTTPAGALYGLALVAFLTMPLVIHWRR